MRAADGTTPGGVAPDGTVPDGAVPNGAVPNGTVPGAAALRAVGRAFAAVGRFLARPAVADVLVVGLFTVWALLLGLGADSMYGLGSHLSADRVLAMQLTSVALTGAGAVALTQRRRRPVVVAAVVAGLGVVSLAVTGATAGFELGLALALLPVARDRTPRVAGTVAAATAGALLVAAAVLPAVATVGAVMVAGNGGEAALRDATPQGPWGFVTTPVWYVTAVPVVVLTLAALVVGQLARSRRLERAALAEAAEARRREQLERDRAGEVAERARIAREMHDVVAHSVSVMVALGGGAAAAFDWAPDRARAALDELVGTGRAALADMRRILGVLHEDGHAPLDPPEDGLDMTVLVDRARAAGLPVRATGITAAELEAVDTARRLAVYRIVQESLTNVLRHAPGTPDVAVTVRRAGRVLEVAVANARPQAPAAVGAAPGPAPAPAPALTVPGSGRGLTGMQQRASALGGTVEAGPHDGGWRVRAVLPVDDEGDG